MNINPSSPVSISVVMCTYNGDKYLEQQIDSILCQTYPIHELIIQDDCSTDRTVTIIEAYQKRDPRVKLYINEAPLGFNYNFSSAFAKAEGEYIASSDQDDIWRPDKIEILMNHATNHSLLFHNSYLFTTDIQQTMGKKNKSNVLYNELYLLMKPYVPGHECFFHRNILPIFQQAVKQENNISYDSLLMLAAVVSGPIEFIDEGLVYWRRHPQATSYHTEQKYNAWEGLNCSEKPKQPLTAQCYKKIFSSCQQLSIQAEIYHPNNSVYEDRQYYWNSESLLRLLHSA